ncbi:MAG: hypothetical protein ACPGNW_08110 [Verrucomicrobiales bacterium]
MSASISVSHAASNSAKPSAGRGLHKDSSSFNAVHKVSGKTSNRSARRAATYSA